MEKEVTAITEKVVPVRCPMCNGAGSLLGGFYDSSVINYCPTGFVPCHHCKGNGLIWCKETTRTTYPMIPDHIISTKAGCWNCAIRDNCERAKCGCSDYILDKK